MEPSTTTRSRPSSSAPYPPTSRDFKLLWVPEEQAISTVPLYRSDKFITMGTDVAKPTTPVAGASLDLSQSSRWLNVFQYCKVLNILGNVMVSWRAPDRAVHAEVALYMLPSKGTSLPVWSKPMCMGWTKRRRRRRRYGHRPLHGVHAQMDFHVPEPGGRKHGRVGLLACTCRWYWSLG